MEELSAWGNFHGKRSSWSSYSCYLVLFISRIFSFAFGFFSLLSVFLFNATARQKACCKDMFFPRNPNPLSLTLGDPVFPLILAWRELFTNLYAFDFGRNTSNLSEFTGCREIWIFNIVIAWRPLTQRVLHQVFLADVDKTQNNPKHPGTSNNYRNYEKNMCN